MWQVARPEETARPDDIAMTDGIAKHGNIAMPDDSATPDDSARPDKVMHQPHDAPLVKCPFNKTFLAEPTVPTALMSFPESGNTWTRHIIDH